MLQTEGKRIADALGEIGMLRKVSRGWHEGEMKLPCAVVQMSGEKAAGHWDDREYLTEVTAYVRCYGKNAGELEALAPLVREAMEGLGYQREFAWEDGNGAALGLVERYKTYLTNI